MDAGMMIRALFVLAFASVAGCALSDQSVYSTKLDNGWQDWSWAKVVKSGKNLDVTAKAWQGLYFYHTPQKASEYARISFKVNGGKVGGQRLQVMATVNKKPVKEAHLAPLKPGWTTVTVTMKSLGLAGKDFDGFWVQAQQGTVFQVSEVVLKSK